MHTTIPTCIEIGEKACLKESRRTCGFYPAGIDFELFQCPGGKLPEAFQVFQISGPLSRSFSELETKSFRYSAK